MDHTTLKLLHAALGALDHKQLSMLTSTTAVGASLEDYSSESNSRHEVAHDLVKWCRSRGRIPALVDALLEGEYREGEAVRRLQEHLRAHPNALRERWLDDVAQSHWGWKAAIGAACVLTLCGGGLLGRRAWLRRNPWRCEVRRLSLPVGPDAQRACFPANYFGGGDPRRAPMRPWARYQLTLTRRVAQPAASRLVVPCEASQVLMVAYEQRANTNCVQQTSRLPCGIPLTASCGNEGVFRLRILQCGVGDPAGAPPLPPLYVDRGENEDRDELSCETP